MKRNFFGALALLAISLNSVNASELSSAQSLASNGVITDASDYRLGDTITRKEMMKIVMNLSGKNIPDTCNGSFGDVANDWGCKYIEKALSEGFIAKNANFRPNDTITKAESMKLILQARGIEKVQNTPAWQDDYMQTAFQNGIVKAKYSDHNTKATRGWIFEASATPTSTVKDTPITSLNSAGVYVDYDASLIGATDTTVLFFHASWCPSCRTADAAISEEDFSTTDITLLKTDYDSNTDLRKKYGVTTQHTFVQVDRNGELIKKWTGSNSLRDITSKIQ